MEKMIIKVPQEAANYLQSLHYTMEAREELLLHMARNGVGPGNEAFDHYHRLFEESFVAFNEAKRSLEVEHIRPAAAGKLLSWTLDYTAGEAECETEIMNPSDKTLKSR